MSLRAGRVAVDALADRNDELTGARERADPFPIRLHELPHHLVERLFRERSVRSARGAG
jgi:hypothetical protein